jgi:hypothetical protein
MLYFYEGLAMTLSQDYKAGGLTAEGAGDEGCHGDGQFEEWHCRHVGGPSDFKYRSSISRVLIIQ